MMTGYHSWRAAIRIARRDAWRFKGRSFLVLAMIALPILGVSAADLTIRSAELSTEQNLRREIGAADARFTDPDLGGTPLLQSPNAEQYNPVGDFDDKPYPDGHGDIRKALPPGAKTLTDTVGSAKLRTTHGLLSTQVRELTTTDPMTKGIARLTKGRFPRNINEVSATTQFLKNSGLHIGSKVTARGLAVDYRIVGAYELPSDLKAEQVNALPGALLAPLGKAIKAQGLEVGYQSSTQLVSVPGGFTWNMVQKTNKSGITVLSRAVMLHPPADADVPLFQSKDWNNYQESSAASEQLAAAATVVGLAMLEICLLAGPAFAVGARRSRRQLGLVGANGGDRRHIRAIVLSGGLVIGVASAVVGTVLGVGLTLALQPVLEDVLGQRFGSFNVRPLELLGIALLAVLTGLLAAIVPAVTASRQTVLASLTGRRGVRRTSRVLPTLGLIAFLLGGALALYGSTMTKQYAVVAGGSAIAELGVVALTPALVGLFGKAGRWMSLSPRLALRDAVRNRGRTAPAVAAVLAAVAGTVAVSTYAASSDAENRAAYEPSLPRGAISMMITEDAGRDVATARQAVAKTTPVDVEADIARISVGKPGCSPYSDAEGCGRYEVVVPPANNCPLWENDANGETPKFSKAERRKLADDPRCVQSTVYSGIDGGVAVGDAKVLSVLGIDDPAAVKALDAGHVVSFNKLNLGKDGKAGIRLITDPTAADEASAKGEDPPGTVKKFTTHQVPAGTNAYGLEMLIPPAAAKAAGISTLPLGAYFSTTSMPSSAQQQKLDSELAKTGSSVDLQVEKGYVSKNSIVLLSLSIFAGLVTIGAAGIATGLAQADAEADLKTLAAVGAPSRVRRTLSGFQCGVVAAMGVLLGTASGVLPAIGLRLTEKRSALANYQESIDAGSGRMPVPHIPIVIPWETLGLLLIAVPLGAAVLAALVTRSRGALSRRAAT
ncbi:membrane protein [Streptomyces sp. AcH 505]|uniref:FtsX-like permease family protein n=1 Tax=Streptomyces sp. AcH 505 TaxID=352211 RepID=UPI000591BE30|nr:membrane protein [Streptomyces sp. AcH 505]